VLFSSHPRKLSGFYKSTFTVPPALGGKTIHPYSDFLLHNIGTGDGIVQNGPPDTASKNKGGPFSVSALFLRSVLELPRLRLRRLYPTRILRFDSYLHSE